MAGGAHPPIATRVRASCRGLGEQKQRPPRSHARRGLVLGKVRECSMHSGSLSAVAVASEPPTAPHQKHPRGGHRWGRGAPHGPFAKQEARRAAGSECTHGADSGIPQHARYAKTTNWTSVCCFKTYLLGWPIYVLFFVCFSIWGSWSSAWREKKLNARATPGTRSYARPAPPQRPSAPP